MNPASEWISEEVPHLRIIDDALWARMKQHQGAIREEILTERAEGPKAPRIERGHRPRYLLSGSLTCGCCGSAYILISASRLGCAVARNSGTCSNRKTIKRTDVETRVLSGLKDHLLHPDLIQEFIAEFQRESRKERLACGPVRPDPPRSLAASGHWSVPAAPLHAETPASAGSRVPENTSWFLSWCSPLFPGKSNQAKRLAHLGEVDDTVDLDNAPGNPHQNTKLRDSAPGIGDPAGHARRSCAVAPGPWRCPCRRRPGPRHSRPRRNRPLYRSRRTCWTAECRIRKQPPLHGPARIELQSFAVHRNASQAWRLT